MKVVVNVSSLEIEEITPSFQSDSNLLAHEEILATRPRDVRKIVCYSLMYSHTYIAVAPLKLCHF